MTVVALIGLGCGLLLWSWRNKWGPWPRWVHSVHSSAEYQATTIASVAAVEGRVPGAAPDSAVCELIRQLGLGLLGSQTVDAVRSLRMMTRMDSDPWLMKAARDALGD